MNKPIDIIKLKDLCYTQGFKEGISRFKQLAGIVWDSSRKATLKEVFEDLDRIMIRRHLPNCRLRWIITENAFGRLKKKYLGVKK
jgi:hypothetical protein